MNGNTMLISHAAMVEEANAVQTAVAGMERRSTAEPDTSGIWSVDKRVDKEPGSSGIWTVEKRADEGPGSTGIWAVEKRASAAAKSKQLKRANYLTPRPWRPDA